MEISVLLSTMLFLSGQQGPQAAVRVEVRTLNAPVAAADVVVAGRTYPDGRRRHRVD